MRSAAWKDLVEHDLVLQGSQRRPAQRRYKLDVQLLQLPQVLLKIQGNRIGQLLHTGRILIGALLAVLEARERPLSLDAEVLEDSVNRVRLWQWPPIDLLRSHIC